MQVRQIVFAVVALALGTAARAESIIPCNFVDDFCVAPPQPRAGAAAAPGSERSASAHPLIRGNFVDDFGVEPGPAGDPAPAVAVPSKAGRGAEPASGAVAQP